MFARVFRRPAVTWSRAMLLMGLMLAACSDRGVSPTDVVPQASRAERSDAGGQHWTIDDMFTAIADSVPGFSGFWFDASGRIVVGMQDPSTLTASVKHRLAQLEYALRPGRRSAPPRGRMLDFTDARAVRSDYSFRDLMDVYSGTLYAARSSIEELVFTDIDERENRIVIAVSSDAHVVGALSALRKSGVREAMVRVVVEGRPRLNFALSDPLRPVPGGARVYFQQSISTDYKPCTAGFMLVRYVGTIYDTVATARHFISTSHCSTDQWQTDYGHVYQGGSFAAAETGDPTYFTGFPCPSGQQCRYSDANLMTFHHDSITADFPRIAYPSTDGSTSFSAYKAVSASDVPYNGMTIKMVGATSGRQSGEVTATCADRQLLPGLTLRCQNDASYYGTIGDSGAPVVSLYADGTVSAVGQHWGNVTVNNVWQKSTFSPMYAILDEFYYKLPSYPFFSPFWY